MTRTFIAPSSRLAQGLRRPFSHGWRRDVLSARLRARGLSLEASGNGSQAVSSKGAKRSGPLPCPKDGRRKGYAARAARKETLRRGGTGRHGGGKPPAV